jgi:serine phosphatase RsbU (regulator of sigma subunit)
MDDKRETDIQEPDDPKTVAFTGDGPATPGVTRIHWLVVLHGSEQGKRIEIADAPVHLGRKKEADLQLKDSMISSKHCRVQLVLDQIIVTDLESTNGTFVDGERISGDQLLPVGSMLHIGNHVLKHEVLSREEAERRLEREDDLNGASSYVRSLLPAPITEGPVLTDWVFVPCATLGGDAFGYQPLPDSRFAIYLLDVCGHGTGPAMHSVSVLNVLSQQALPGAELGNPSDVLRVLNNMFLMDQHAGMYFTMWYGVYSPDDRSLLYASGGHPPAFLVSADRATIHDLQTRNPGVGLFPGSEYTSDQITLSPGSSLYLYSDGAFEIALAGGEEWTLEALRNVIAKSPVPSQPEGSRIHRDVLTATLRRSFDDDFSILVARFP